MSGGSLYQVIISDIIIIIICPMALSNFDTKKHACRVQFIEVKKPQKSKIFPFFGETRSDVFCIVKPSPQTQIPKAQQQPSKTQIPISSKGTGADTKILWATTTIPPHLTHP